MKRYPVLALKSTFFSGKLLKGGILGLTELGGSVHSPPLRWVEISQRILGGASRKFLGILPGTKWPISGAFRNAPGKLDPLPPYPPAHSRHAPSQTWNFLEFLRKSPVPEAPNPISIRWFSIDMNSKCDQKLNAIILPHFPVNADQIYDW